MSMRLTVTLATAVLATTLAMSAKADQTPTTDWARVLVDLDTVARKGADALDTPRCARAGCQTDTNTTAAQPERSVNFHVQNRSSQWISVTPKLSLVARDWGAAYRVAGDRLALVDSLRLTTSTRMILGSVRLSDSRIAPFAQVGLGQWRTDPFLLPLTPRYTEVAAQAAGGVEVRVMGTWLVALETTMTMLYRESRGVNDLPATKIWSTAIASRVDF